MAGSRTGVENIQCEPEACYGGKKKKKVLKNKKIPYDGDMSERYWDQVEEVLIANTGIN